MLRGVKHVTGLRRNLISLGVLHDGDMEFRCDRDTKTMQIMKDGVTVMIGERTASHLQVAGEHYCRWSHGEWSCRSSSGVPRWRRVWLVG